MQGKPAATSTRSFKYDAGSRQLWPNMAPCHIWLLLSAACIVHRVHVTCTVLALVQALQYIPEGTGWT